MNRLTGITLKRSSGQDLHCGVTYDALGRMTSRQAVTAVNGVPQVTTVFSQPVFLSTKVHALATVQSTSDLFPPAAQSITYTSFEKASKVKQGNDSICYTYGYDHQRIRMEEHVGSTFRTKDYVGMCEYVTETNGTRSYTYLNGPYGVFAVIEKQNGVQTPHYVLKDNLGSWNTITDGDGTVEQRLSYDAWGNLRNPDTWANYTAGDSFNKPMFDRGYTGHEHLTSFGLINMNGRMYDPVMSSFLSVDQYVQSPSNSQNFNRYAYCLNNPLRYTDPSGELLWETVVAGAIIGTFSNTAAQVMSGNVNNGGQFWVAAGIGAISGGLGGLFGYQVGYGMNLLLHGTEGFWLGSVAGAASGFAGGFVDGSCAAWLQGASFSKGFWAGLKSGGLGALTGGLLGGLEAGYYAKQNGGNFWTGDNTIVAEHHTVDKYKGTKTKAMTNAKRYNNSSRYIEDVKKIKNKMNELFNNWELNVSGEIETRTGNYGMNDNMNSYVDIQSKGTDGFDMVDGFVSKRRSGFFLNNVKYDVHIAPGVAAYDVTSFKAVVGHELIHSLHYNLFGLNFDLAQSERAAYKYTINVYNNAGDYLRARQNLEFAIKKGFFNLAPNYLYITPF